MSARFRFEAYVIVSSEGMIADSHAFMPETLKNDADKEFFERGLDQADVVVHGRNSHEHHANSAGRRRIILTRKVAATAPDPDCERCVLWNPAGATFEEACALLGLSGGVAAIIGGPVVYSFFLDAYDAFHLTRIDTVQLPQGLFVFTHHKPGLSPEDVLAKHGLAPGEIEDLDKANAVTLCTWRKKAAS
jgi:hypothetical protein